MEQNLNDIEQARKLLALFHETVDLTDSQLKSVGHYFFGPDSQMNSIIPSPYNNTVTYLKEVLLSNHFQNFEELTAYYDELADDVTNELKQSISEAKTNRLKKVPQIDTMEPYSINAVNYGLLPLFAAEHKSFDIHVSLDNQDMVTVKLINCRAVTPGGHLIFIDEKHQYSAGNLSPSLMLQAPLSDFKDRPGIYAVIVAINPASRLTLSLVPVAFLQGIGPGLYFLCVANILIEKNKVQKSEEYIAPCTSTSSHPELVNIFYGLDEFMCSMEFYSLQILQKINQKHQTNELAFIIQQICERLIQLQNTSYSLFRWSALHSPPHVMFSHIAAQARLIKNSLDIYVNGGKEELMNYFTEWCGLSQGELETVITDLSNHWYSHEDIHGVIVKTEAYTRQVSSLFYKLSQLNYIGMKKEAAIFVKEDVLKPDIPNAEIKKRRSFLGDE